MTRPTILIIDDDYSINASLGLLLKQAGFASVGAADPDEALAVLAERSDIALVLQDMNFSRLTTGEEGLALLARIRETRPQLPVILITAWGSVELAVAGMKAGAVDFVTKPWRNTRMLQAVQVALDLAASRNGETTTARKSRAELDANYDFRGLVGEDPQLLETLELLGRVSATDASILITGESGTGKEVVATAIHRNSQRHGAPFVKVNLGGIASSLFESEIFGHVRGAFTDANRDRRGRFEMAEGGTILLDEIGELGLRDQVKMLRVLQDRTYEVLGSSETRCVDVRVIAATNRDLAAAVSAGEFREDLLYRLNLISVRLPSLAQRRGDIPLLAQHFLAEADTVGDEPANATDEALGWLQRQDWPGNVRQLRHLIQRTLLVTGSRRLDVQHFQRTHDMEGGSGSNRDQLPPVGSMTIDALEESMIRKTLAHHDGNISHAAEALGLSRAALYRRLEKYGIEP